MTASSLASAAASPVWWDGLADSFGTRASLGQDLDVDVAIIGAGYTGLWTAYELAAADPSLSIAVLERSHVGFGASGRNGGWCYDGFAAGMDRIESMSDIGTARAFAAVLRDTVDVIGKVVATEGIDCDFHLGGSVEFLRNGAQLTRAERNVEVARRYGWLADDLRLLSPGEARSIGRAADLQGGMWSRRTAAIQPAKLALGLANAVERRGVTIYENTPVSRYRQGTVETAEATVHANVIIRATEGYTAELPGYHRTLAPLYSIMIATEPLSDELWQQIGLAERQTFGDLRHLVIYGQRTADGRIAFGGRGAPYGFGSSVKRNADLPSDAFIGVHEALVEVFPQLSDTAITHRWAGVLGVSRTWMPTVGFNPATGLGWAGGYVGSGVAATNLAGRTLAALVTESASDLVRFPWVNKQVRRWEPEPLRWIGINAALKIMTSADAVEDRRHRPAKRADVMWRIAKH